MFDSDVAEAIGYSTNIAVNGSNSSGAPQDSLTAPILDWSRIEKGPMRLSLTEVI